MFAKFGDIPELPPRDEASQDRSNSALVTQLPKSHWLHGTKIYFVRLGFNSGQVALLSISSPVKDSRILTSFPCLIIVSEHGVSTYEGEEQAGDEGDVFTEQSNKWLNYFHSYSGSLELVCRRSQTMHSFCVFREIN